MEPTKPRKPDKPKKPEKPAKPAKPARPCTQARPSSDDLGRIVRLEEEIIGRIEEMARIVARTLGNAPVLPVTAFTRREEPATASAPEVAWHEFTTPDGKTGCWDNVHDICCEGPCPC